MSFIDESIALKKFKKSDWLQIEDRNRIIEILKNYKRVLVNFLFKDLGGKNYGF